MERAVELAQAAANPICGGPPPGIAGPPQAHEVAFQKTYGGSKTRWLVLVVCSTGAYNVSSVAFEVDAYEQVTLLPFPRPTFRYEYEDEASTKLKSLVMTGMAATQRVVNGQWDAKAGTLETLGSWRGLSDAFDTATYRLTDDGFQLVKFAVDPTYDGEQTPTTLYEAPAQ